jgi:hypothetical protein
MRFATSANSRASRRCSVLSRVLINLMSSVFMRRHFDRKVGHCLSNVNNFNKSAP